MSETIMGILKIMLPTGRYLERCAPDHNGNERFKVYDGQRHPLYYIRNKDLDRLGFWAVFKKDNDLAFRKKVDHYYISRRKILALRKNNPIKRTYKSMRDKLIAP